MAVSILLNKFDFLMFGETWLLERVTFWIPLVFSLTVHEWAHAWSAYHLGDVTAQRDGRMTLNPLAHIDPVGTLLLPMVAPIGWARPVPVNMGLFHRDVGPRTGVVLVAAAGPISNLCLAFLGGLLLLASVRWFGSATAVPAAWYSLLNDCILVNVLLAIFNLIPVPPLDGSRIVDALLPDSLRGPWDVFCSLGPASLILVLVVVAATGGVIFTWPIEATRSAIDSLLMLCSV